MYTLSTHYLHTIYTLSTQYLHNIYTLSKQYLHDIYTLSKQYLHIIHYLLTVVPHHEAAHLAGEHGEVGVLSLPLLVPGLLRLQEPPHILPRLGHPHILYSA